MAQHAWMVPLDLKDSATMWLMNEILSNRKRGMTWLTLRHALIEQDSRFWGNDPKSPSSIVYIREGDHELEVFGLLSPRPAVRWLVSLGRPVALVASQSWVKAVQIRAGAFDWGEIASWMPGFNRGMPRPSAVVTRRLTLADSCAFANATPEWALRCWRDFDAMIGRGCAIGVPFGKEFASVAWIFDGTESFDAIGVHTLPRFRQLGLARAAASALVEHIIAVRRKIPLWATSTRNSASLALARSLGFTPRVVEPVFRWPPHTGVTRMFGDPATALSSWIAGDDR